MRTRGQTSAVTLLLMGAAFVALAAACAGLYSESFSPMATISSAQDPSAAINHNEWLTPKGARSYLVGLKCLVPISIAMNSQLGCQAGAVR